MGLGAIGFRQGNAGHVYGITNNLNSSRSQTFTYDQVNRILSAGTTATTGAYCPSADEDIHSRTAQEVFGVAPFAQTPEHRRVAKVINFGVIYGLSSFGLAQQLDIDTKEASKFITAYFERYSGVKKFLDRLIAETRESGFTRTLFGRVRPIPEINSPQPNLRSFAERTVMNTPMQGAAADLIKLAMIELDRRLADGFQSRMILQVHDELLFESPEKEIPRLTALVKEVMEGVHKLRVPLIVETKVGPNWRDMK